MRMWIDTEFNGFQGELISLALVAESGDIFYIVREATKDMDIHPWVADHVVPFLNDNPFDLENEWVDDASGRDYLSSFLSGFDDIEIIADWPEDIAHFCHYLISGPGYMIDTPENIKFTVDRTLNGESEVPHNALYDAMGNMSEQLNREYVQREKNDVA